MNNKATLLLTFISEDFSLLKKGNYFTTEEHDSLVIDPRKGLFFWNSKGLYGDVLSYLIHIRGLNYHDAIELIANTKSNFSFEILEPVIEKPNVMLVDIFYNYGKDYSDYWKNYRGYTDETIDRFLLGFTGKYWVIPIFNGGTFMNFECRGWDRYNNKIVKSFYRGIGRLPFNFDNLPKDKHVPIYITESMVDAIMLIQNGHFAISSNAGANGWDHDWSLKLFDYDKIYIVYDNDDAGRNGAKRTSTYLAHNSEILLWPKQFPDKYDITNLYKDGKRIEDLKDHFISSFILRDRKS